MKYAKLKCQNDAQGTHASPTDKSLRLFGRGQKHGYPKLRHGQKICAKLDLSQFYAGHLRLLSTYNRGWLIAPGNKPE